VIFDKGSRKKVSSINDLGKTGYLYAEKWNLDSCDSPYSKVNSKWIKDLNVRPETMKQPEEKIGETLQHIGLGKQYGGSSKNYNRTTIWSRNSTTGYVPKVNEICMLKTDLYSHVYCSTINNSQDTEST
jgi:hypothetical protein